MARPDKPLSVDDPSLEAMLTNEVVDFVNGEPQALEAGSEPIILDLSDLVADTNGEVVLFNDSLLGSIGIRTNSAVLDSGKSEEHTTASGDDVSGFRYILFENGTKLFYREDLEVFLTTHEGRAAR